MKLNIPLTLLNPKLSWMTSYVVLIGLCLSQVQAEVTLDGSLGSTGSLSGPNFNIPANIGRQVGTNLFHSFSKFNLSSSESATFTSQGSMGSIQNILSRVTGGKSLIDGLLKSTIPDANLYFINPAGIVFGKNAQLDVQGSFHASTADYLRLEDGSLFNALPSVVDAILTSAPPEAFGFLNNNPSNIAVIGSQIQIPNGKTLSLIGNDIEIRNGMIVAPEGKINLVSIRSAGEILLDTNNVEETDFLRGDISITEQTKINVNSDKAGSIFLDGNDIEISSSSILAETGNQTGGLIEIIADSLFLEGGSNIKSETIGNGEASTIKIIAPIIEIDPGSEISSSTFDKGNAGNVEIQVLDLNIDGTGAIQFITGITSIANSGSTGNAGSVVIKGIVQEKAENITVNNGGTRGNFLKGLAGIGSIALFSLSGNAGTVEIHTKNLELIGGGAISTSTFSSSGNAGTVVVNADKIFISGIAEVRDRDIPSSIDSSALDLSTLNNPTGNAGVVDITARLLILEKGGAISSITHTQGDAGIVNIHVSDLISITGIEKIIQSTGITASAQFGSSGKAGNISVETARLIIDGNGAITFTGIGSLARTDSLGNSGKTTVTATKNITILNGGNISSSTFSKGNAGDVIVKTEYLLVDGINSGILLDTENVIPSAIGSTAERLSEGDAGNTQVTANTIELRNGGIISSRSLGSGQVGDVIVSAENILIESGANISASSLGSNQLSEVNDPGKVDIRIGNSLSLENGGSITVETLGINAGDISINGKDDNGNQSITIQLFDNSQINTTVNNGTGNGGNITIDNFNSTVFLSIDGSSNIIANAKQGSGGNINISTDFLFGTTDNITASSEKGISGTVNIDSPDTDISSGLLNLPASFFDSTSVLNKPCVQQSAANAISLVIQKFQVLPHNPYALWDHVNKSESDTHTINTVTPYLKLAGLQTLDKDCLANE